MEPFAFYQTYVKNVHSQNGEDGIIEEILHRLKIGQGWVCEFGAWDGIHLSNTFRLIEHGFKGVYIEGDVDKFQDLIHTQRKYPNITAIRAFVGHTDDPDTELLDNILQRTDIPIDFDVLSIDIDSYDYQVWDSVQVYKPKIVIIEINSGIKPDDENHIHTPGIYDGTGFLPTLQLGIRKGYKFVVHTGNIIFVREDLFDMLHIKDSSYYFLTYWLKA